MSEAPKPDSKEGGRRTSIWRMYAAVVGVGIFCALIIVIVYLTTRPIIKQNRIEFRELAIRDVLPAVRTIKTFAWIEGEGFELVTDDETNGEMVFAGYGADDQLVGLAIEAEAMGYADVIRLIYGYSVKDQAVIGIRVLESRETPGLGDQIETDEDFLKNFEKLDVRLDESGDHLANPIELVKPGKKEEAWQIDGISGATISSRATAFMLGESAAVWAPRIQKHKQDFAK